MMSANTTTSPTLRAEAPVFVSPTRRHAPHPYTMSSMSLGGSAVFQAPQVTASPGSSYGSSYGGAFASSTASATVAAGAGAGGGSPTYNTASYNGTVYYGKGAAKRAQAAAAEARRTPSPPAAGQGRVFRTPSGQEVEFTAQAVNVPIPDFL